MWVSTTNGSLKTSCKSCVPRNTVEHCFQGKWDNEEHQGPFTLNISRNEEQMLSEWKIFCVCCIMGYTELSGNGSRWLANIAYLESCRVAACRATSRVDTFHSSHRWIRLPWRCKGSRTRDSRGKIIEATSKNRNIIWEEDILYFFLSWSCEDLSLVVSFLLCKATGDFLMAQTALFDCRQILLFTPVRILGWPHCIISKNPWVMSVSDVLFQPACSHRPQISFMPASCR